MVPGFRNSSRLLVERGTFLICICHQSPQILFQQPYGRNWTFLWSVPIPQYQILILVVIFFVGVWAAMLAILTHFSKTHTWLLPVFAVGLGAPRWCQMLWGTSSLALYIPWAGRGGPYLGISLWLWLGVLDAVQGVGLGLILLQVCAQQCYRKELLPKFLFRPCLAYTSAPRSHLRRSLVQFASWLLVQLLRIALVPNQFFQMHPNGISAKGLKGVQWNTQLSGSL